MLVLVHVMDEVCKVEYRYFWTKHIFHSNFPNLSCLQILFTMIQYISLWGFCVDIDKIFKGALCYFWWNSGCCWGTAVSGYKRRETEPAYTHFNQTQLCPK